MAIPVVIATNGYGLPVKAVSDRAPNMVVASNGYGVPIVLSDFGVPFVVSGLGPSTTPSAFSDGGWSVSDATTGGQIDVAISSLPDNGGSPITDVEYRLDAGSWVSSGGVVGFSIAGLTDDTEYDVELRAVNSVGNGDASSVKAATPTTATTAPAAFEAGDWSLANPASGAQLNVTISSLPDNGGATITDVEYRLDGGSWVSTGGTTSFNITSLTDDTEYDVELRAVNSVGDGPASDTKSATPTTAATAPAAFTAGQWSVADATTGGRVNVTITTLPDDGGATITDVEYRIDAGSWTSSSGTSDFNITGLTDDTEIDLQLRAVNSVGNGNASDTKAVTPTEADTTAPVINSMSFNAGTGALNVNYTETNLPTTVRWHVRLASSGAPNEAAMLAGTGALDSGSFSSATTTDSEGITLDGGLDADDYTMYVMISDGVPNHSNIEPDDFTLATAPDAFETGDWSVADAASGGEVDVTITSLPAANNATITDVEYSVDNGTWTSTGGTTSFSITSLTNGVEVDVEIRAVNSEGNGPDGVSKAVTPTSGASAPSAFVAGDWTLTDPASDGDLLVTINSLPINGGSAITDVEYRVDGGTWTTSGGTVTFTISGLTNSTEYDVELRAINAVGNGATGDLKSQTPTAGAGGLSVITSDTVTVTAGTAEGGVSLPTSLENDLVVLFLGCNNGISDDSTTAAGFNAYLKEGTGWTVLDNASANASPGRMTAYKVMGSTPDTTATVRPPEGSGKDLIVHSVVVRGADTSTPIDNSISVDNDTTGLPNAPSHTTVTNGAERFIFGVLDDDEETLTAPSGWTTLETASIRCSTIVCHKSAPTAGADDPDAFGGTLDDAWAAHHIAVRPA